MHTRKGFRLRLKAVLHVSKKTYRRLSFNISIAYTLSTIKKILHIITGVERLSFQGLIRKKYDDKHTIAVAIE